MDPNKFFQSKPLSNKRKAEDAEESSVANARVKEEAQSIKASEIWDSEARLEPAQIDALIDDAIQGENMDERWAKKLVVSFEKALKKNQEMRAKHELEPEKFLRSEVDLNEEVRNLFQLAASPNYLELLTQPHALESLGMLLTHENTDLLVAAVELIQELTEDEVEVEEARQADSKRGEFVEALISNHILDLVIQAMLKFDEENAEEAKGVFAALGVIENFTSYDAEIAAYLSKLSEFLEWLLKRLSRKEFDSNKLYTTEVLAILLQLAPSSQDEYLKKGFIDKLLEAVAPFKGKDPKDDEEQEMLENLFDCICSLLSSEKSKKAFVEAEGVELMLIMLEKKRLSRFRALKVLSFCVSGFHLSNKEICNRIVDCQGLKHIFSCFMKKSSKSLKKAYPKAYVDSEEDEHTLSILAALFRYLDNSKPEVRQLRLAAKFEDQGKLERLVRLYSDYTIRIFSTKEEAQHNFKTVLQRGTEEDVAELKEYLHSQLLDAGLYTLQMITLILVELACGASTELLPKVRSIAQSQDITKSQVAEILEEYAVRLDEVENGKEEKHRVLKLMEAYYPDYFK